MARRLAAASRRAPRTPAPRALSSRNGGAAARRLGVQTQAVLNELASCKSLDALATVVQRNRTELGPATVVAALAKRAQLASAPSSRGSSGSRTAPSMRAWRRVMLAQLLRPQRYSLTQLATMLRSFVAYGEADVRLYDAWARQLLACTSERRAVMMSSRSEVDEDGRGGGGSASEAENDVLSPALATELLGLGDAVGGAGAAASSGVNPNYRLSPSLLLSNAGGVAREGAHRLLAAATVTPPPAPLLPHEPGSAPPFHRRRGQPDAASPVSVAAATAARLSHALLFPRGSTPLAAAAAPLCLWTCTNALGRAFERLAVSAASATSPATSLDALTTLARVSSHALRQELVWNLSSLEKRVRRWKEGGGGRGGAGVAAGGGKAGNAVTRKEALAGELAALRTTAFGSPVLAGGLALVRATVAAAAAGAPAGADASAPARREPQPSSGSQVPASTNEVPADPLGLGSNSKASPAARAGFAQALASSSSSGTVNATQPLQLLPAFEVPAALAAVDTWIAGVQGAMRQEGGYPLPPQRAKGKSGSSSGLLATSGTAAASAAMPPVAAASAAATMPSALVELLEASLLALHAPALVDPVAVRRGAGLSSKSEPAAAVVAAFNTIVGPAALTLVQRFETLAGTIERWAAIRGGDVAEVLPPPGWAAVSSFYTAAGPLLRAAVALRDWAALATPGSASGITASELSALQSTATALVEALSAAVTPKRVGVGPLQQRTGSGAAATSAPAPLMVLCSRWARHAGTAAANSPPAAHAAAVVDLAAAVVHVARPAAGPLLEAAAAALLQVDASSSISGVSTPLEGLALTAVQLADVVCTNGGGASDGSSMAPGLSLPLRGGGTPALQIATGLVCEALEALHGGGANSGSGSGDAAVMSVPVAEAATSHSQQEDDDDDEEEEDGRLALGNGKHAGIAASSRQQQPKGAGFKTRVPLADAEEVADASPLGRGNNSNGSGSSSSGEASEIAATAARHAGRAQTLLQAAAADVAATGRLAPATAAALAAFRRATGATGAYALLVAAVAPLSAGRSGGAVRVAPSLYLSLTLPQVRETAGGGADAEAVTTTTAAAAASSLPPPPTPRPRFKTLRYGHVVSDPTILSQVKLPPPYDALFTGSPAGRGSSSSGGPGAEEGRLDWFDWSGMFAQVDADAAATVAGRGSADAASARVDVVGGGSPAASSSASSSSGYASAGDSQSSDDELLTAVAATSSSAAAAPRSAVRSAQRLKLSVGRNGWDSSAEDGGASDGDIRVLPPAAAARGGSGVSGDDWDGLSDLEGGGGSSGSASRRGSLSPSSSSSDEASDAEGSSSGGARRGRHASASAPLHDLEDAAGASPQPAEALAPPAHRVLALPPVTSLALADLLVLLLTDLQAASRGPASTGALKTGFACLAQLSAALQGCIVAAAPGASGSQDAVSALLQSNLPSFRRVAIRSKAEALTLALSGASTPSPAAQQLLTALSALV